MEQEKEEKTAVAGQRSPRWALWEWMEIPSRVNLGEAYLVRLRIVQTPNFALYLHRINEPDSDRFPHDHPWNFRSLIVRGSYTEQVYDNPSFKDSKSYKRRWNQFSIHKMVRGQAHKIISVAPGTISLIFVGKRQGDWGFYTDQGWVDWKTYEESK